METTGGAVVARMLALEGVDAVFGIIDGTYFGLYSSFAPNGIRLFTPRHETSAAHMAGAFARLTGRLGVCMASNGPGVANLLPGLVVEQAEGNRVLAITSSRRTGIGYPDRGGTYQYFDQTGVIARIAKWSATAPSFERIPELMRAALRRCWEGRPGVVHLDIPENLMNGKVKEELAYWQPREYRRSAPPAPPPDLVARAAEMLTHAEQPLIHAGSGIVHAGAYEELAAVAELLQAPVTTSWAARGALAERSDLALPMIHIKLNNKARNDADVVLALGTRFGETDWWGKAPNWRQPSQQRLIQVDIDGTMLGVNKPAELAIESDAKAFLAALRAELQSGKKPASLERRKSRLAEYRAARAKDRAKWDAALSDARIPMHPARIAPICRSAFPEGSVLVADGGNATIWTMFYVSIERPNTLLSTFKFGMLGAGVAQALGAAVAQPGEPVCCIIGDGAMGFHPQEIETAVRHGLRVIFVVVCDRQWGMVKMNQSFQLRPWKTLLKKHLDPGENIATDLGEIAYDRLAQAMGAHGERVAEAAALRPALDRALASGRCAVVHVDVDPVQHMWAPGLLHFKKMHEEPSGR